MIAAVASLVSNAYGFAVPVVDSSSFMIQNDMLQNLSQDMVCETAVTGAIRFNVDAEIIEYPVKSEMWKW
jgi:hypothetical protein